MIIVSTKNWLTIARRVAPSALRTPISRVRSRTATSITFITPSPPRNSVTIPTAPMKYSMPSIISAFALAFLIVSHTERRFFVLRVEMVNQSQGDARLMLAIRVHGKRFRHDQHVVDRVRRRRWLVRKIADHRTVRNEDLSNVLAVVTRILILYPHHADHGVRHVLQPDRLSDCRPRAEELLFRVAPEERPRG